MVTVEVGIMTTPNSINDNEVGIMTTVDFQRAFCFGYIISSLWTYIIQKNTLLRIASQDSEKSNYGLFIESILKSDDMV